MRLVKTAPNMPQVTLIRHGQTAWSLSGQHTGLTDLPLTLLGEEQARSLAPCLRDVTFSHVLTSPMQRAQKTCALARLATAAEVEPDLLEWDYGSFDGLTSTEIHRSHPDWNVFIDGAPNGETPQQALDRADRLIRRLVSMNGNIAVFSHGQFGRVIAARWIGLPLSVCQHFTLDEASLSTLGYHPDHPDVRVIALWNLPPSLPTA